MRNGEELKLVMQSSTVPAPLATVGCGTRCLRHCHRWCRGSTPTGVCLWLLLYLCLGAVMFMLLEGNLLAPTQQQTRHGYSQRDSDVTASDEDPLLGPITTATVERLWAFTEELNILYRDNWTALARAEMARYQHLVGHALRQRLLQERYSLPHTWSFPMAFLYSLSLISTIGYGAFSPRSAVGQILALFYSALGIPLFLAFLALVGGAWSRPLRRLLQFKVTCCPWPPLPLRTRRSPPIKKPLDLYRLRELTSLSSCGTPDTPLNPYNSSSFCSRLPAAPPSVDSKWPAAILSFLILILYLTAGSCLFTFVATPARTGDSNFFNGETLSFLDGFYLSFSLLTTIGFGTFLAGAEDGWASASSTFMALVSVYILLGMALISTCFALLTDDEPSQTSVASLTNLMMNSPNS